MHWRHDPQTRQTPLAVRSIGTGPTVTKILAAMATLLVMMLLASALWA